MWAGGVMRGSRRSEALRSCRKPVGDRGVEGNRMPGDAASIRGTYRMLAQQQSAAPKQAAPGTGRGGAVDAPFNSRGSSLLNTPYIPHHPHTPTVAHPAGWRPRSPLRMWRRWCGRAAATPSASPTWP